MLPDFIEGKQAQITNEFAAVFLSLGPATRLYGELTNQLIHLRQVLLLTEVSAVCTDLKRTYSYFNGAGTFQ
jgi:hypothetical protein